MAKETTEQRWRGRPVLGHLLRVAIVLVPIAASVVVGAVVGRSLPRSQGLSSLLVWWAAVLGTSTVTLAVADRLARQLLPLAALLRMTMLFPDRAPTRLAVAKRSGTTRTLERRLHEAQHRGVEDEPTKAAVTILALATSLNAHDRTTRGHSERVRALTDMIADELKLPSADRDRLRWSALLHDVGKLTVHPDILNKAGKLSEEEWGVIHRHPLEGARLVGPLLPWLGEWAKTIEQHHERHDGAGYPYGLRGEEISLGGRIVAVADSFDTMTAARSYSRAMSPEAARRELARCSGSQFDPAIVRAFLNVSLGRLRWAAGPLSWLAQLPFVNGLQRAGDLIVVGSRALAGTAAVTVGTSVAVAGAPVAAASHAQEITTVKTVKPVGTAAGSTRPRPRPAPQAPPPPSSAPAPQPAVPGLDANPLAAPQPQPAPLPVPRPHPKPVSATLPAVPPRPTRLPTPPLPPAVSVPPPTPPTLPPAPAPGPAPSSPPSSPPPPVSPLPPIPVPVSAPPAPTGIVPTPMPIADVATTPSGTPVTIAVLANDSGWTGTLDPTSVLVVSAPAHGTTAVAPAGTVTYTPAPGFVGVDSFVYRVCDAGGGGCATAPVTVTVTAPVTPPPPPVPPDPPPVAVPDTATVVKGTTATIGVLSNDSDADGDLDPASLTIVTPPTSGTITVNPDHTVSYTSAANAGADSFIYKVCDQNGPCATAAVTVTVVNNSQGPKTVPTFATTLFGQPVKIDVLASVTPGSSPIVPASLAIDTAPAHGTAVVNADHTITYTPVPGFVGIDNFKYAVKDSLNASSTGNVQVVSA